MQVLAAGMPAEADICAHSRECRFDTHSERYAVYVDNIADRLVGQEFNTGKNDELYASTPPLEVLRFVVSSAAT